MSKAKYDFQDVKNFLKEHYGLIWNGQIHDLNNHITREANEEDIKGDYNIFSGFATITHNNEKIKVVIQVADVYFTVISEKNPHDEKTKEWLELLASKENTQTI